MASATVDPPSSAPLSIPTVDLRLLSQSDLYSLSLSSPPSSSSSSSFVIPQINRSVFNESAGSRKQTYSRLRLARPSSRLSLSSHPHHSLPLKPDPESSENRRILHILKSLLSGTTPTTDATSPPPPLETPGGEKRKRGRPRRPNPNPNPNPRRECVIKDVFVNKEKNRGQNDKDKDRDRIRVNGKGAEVDLGELAGLEDPFSGELERRTEGLKREEDFLGFLGGLSGQWGSRRKKKRVVEAEGFGDFLPKGWKLLLSCKKKEGRVWLYVRRYISPNGRHFMSCKEVASYLLSLFTLEDAKEPQVEQKDNNAQPTQEITYAADSAVNDIKGSVKMECYSPSLVTSISNQMQNTPGVIDSGEIQADNVITCEKCNISFNGKDDFMQHQLESHRRRRSKFGSSITDGVIIVDGQYECQFCHKRFVERHRYNGHAGAHKRHHLKNDENSLYQVHLNECTVQSLSGNDSDSATAKFRTDGKPRDASPDSAFNVGSDAEVYSDEPSNKVNNLPRDEQESQSNTNAQSLTAQQHCFESDVDNKVNGSLGNIDEANYLESAVSMSIDEIDNNGNLIASGFDDYGPSPTAQDNTSGDDIIADSENISLDPRGNENTFGADMDDSPTNLPLETLIIERPEIEINQSHVPSPVPIGNDEDYNKTDGVDMVSSSAILESKQKRLSESDEEVLFGYKDIYTGCNAVSDPETDTTHNSEKKVMIGHEKPGNCSNIPSQTGELDDMADPGNIHTVCTTEASGLERSSEIGSDTFNVGSIYTRETERPNINETHSYRSNEIAFSISQHQIHRPEVRRAEFGVPFLSGHQQIFSEEKTGGFRNEYSMGNPFSDVYTMNGVTNSSTEVPKPDTVLNSDNNELMIDFGNNGSGVAANPMDNVPMEQIFFEIDRSRESRRTGENSKQESNLLGPSYYNKPGGSENYLDRIDTGSVWDGPIIDGPADFGNNKLMIGFSNSGGPSHADPMGANMWRSDDRNTFQSNLAGSATQHVGSSSFLNANMMPAKDDDMFLGYNGVQSAAPEHIEFSFMTPHSIDSYPRHPKTMYNPAMGQGFESSFWLEKDDLSLNIAARNLVTSICVWCRNEFRHEPDNSGIQTGAIGSICPTCSARVSQQFNAF